MFELIFASLFGLIIGSFLNVVIYRIPKDNLSIISPNRSFCPKCKTQLTFWQNIPLISFSLQKFRCPNCKKKISFLYPAIELFTAIITFLTIYKLGVSAKSIFILLLLYALICLFIIDWQEQLLPDVITQPLLWLGLLFNLNSLGNISLENSVIGAIVGYLFLWSIYWIFKLIRKKEGMGYGDFKLLSLLGAWFGWQSLTNILLISSILGIVFALIFMSKKLDKPFAFAPFLILATLPEIYYLF